MPTFEWNADFETGIAFVDRDHRVLVDLLNQIFDAPDDAREAHATLGSVLNSLIDYTHYHFAREELLQEASGYTGFHGHKAEHEVLTTRAQEFRQRYMLDPEAVSLVEMAQFLKDWLINHILGSDKAFVEACADHPEAIAAAEALQLDGSQKTGKVAPGAFTWEDTRILVVEDNRNFQGIITTILRSLGVRDIALAGDGREGLEAIERDAAFDLILCDWRMEGMDGLAFVEAVRRTNREVKVVMMSGYADNDFPERARQAGVDAFLEKPITARGFLETTSRLLSG
ncbi:bacteriohemerythrin [Roseospirillum parvum]|uniref:Hemerythrin-like metal-binding domain protein n=1 Tax=Roseospirillum parvum TaxID=83401 RepID=A0A1G7YKZ1_9PROT|nr:bacteriohemerythrin [Roseospirillum parvum]SDG96510.1 hemerythrin-like metal-binding domain protein [Roseospirillum parvum]